MHYLPLPQFSRLTTSPTTCILLPSSGYCTPSLAHACRWDVSVVLVCCAHTRGAALRAPLPPTNPTRTFCYALFALLGCAPACTTRCLPACSAHCAYAIIRTGLPDYRYYPTPTCHSTTLCFTYHHVGSARPAVRTCYSYSGNYPHLHACCTFTHLPHRIRYTTHNYLLVRIAAFTTYGDSAACRYRYTPVLYGSV